jgi:hypothetical protein
MAVGGDHLTHAARDPAPRNQLRRAVTQVGVDVLHEPRLGLSALPDDRTIEGGLLAELCDGDFAGCNLGSPASTPTGWRRAATRRSRPAVERAVE